MPRSPRSYIKTSYFHVITQGINKDYIFENSDDIKHYIKTMYKLSQEQEVKILSYCIMNNHAHILVYVENLKQLSKYMQRLNTNYGKYFNKKYNRIGYVFRDRYKSEGIYSEKHLYNCMKYIYDNPVKAGICATAEEYPYSNYRKIDKIINETYIFLDVEEDNEKLCQSIIKNFLIENNIELESLKREKAKLTELIKILKNEANISLREIAKNMNLNRETVRRIYNR